MHFEKKYIVQGTVEIVMTVTYSKYNFNFTMKKLAKLVSN